MSEYDEDEDDDGGDDGDDDDEGDGEGDDDEELDEEELKRLALEKEESVRKDIERLRHIFMHIDTTSARIQRTIDMNDTITAQQIEIDELKHIIETQNKSLVGGRSSGDKSSTTKGTEGADKVFIFIFMNIN